MHVIYQIRNLINNKIYIGSAINFSKRCYNHRALLRKNKHHSKHLQSSWNKYGEENFVFEILEKIEDKNKLIEREQFYLDNSKSWDDKIGYNMNKSANSRLGTKWTNEQKMKMKNYGKPMYFKGKIHSLESKEKNRQAHLGKPHSEITKIKMSISRMGKNNNNFGKICSADTRAKISKGNTGKKHPGINNSHPKSVDQFDLNENFIKTWNSQKEATLELNICRGNICTCCKGKIKTAGNYIWKYHGTT